MRDELAVIHVKPLRSQVPRPLPPNLLPMAAALFSLIIDSSGKSPTRFPLSLVSTEEEARRNAVTSFPKSLASPAALRLILRMLGRFWTKSGVQTPFVVASVSKMA